MMADRMVVKFQREEGSDNYDFLYLLHKNNMQMFVFDALLFTPLSNDGDTGLSREHIKLSDYFIPKNSEMEHCCQLKQLKLPNGKTSLSLIPTTNYELDPFCVGIILCTDLNSRDIIESLESKIPYINHYLDDEVWEYETVDGDYSSDVCGGFLSMDEAIDYFFQFNKIQDYTIICDGIDQTEFFHQQARRAEFKKSLSEYLPAHVVNGILNSISDDDIETITNRHTESKEQKEKLFRSLHL